MSLRQQYKKYLFDKQGGKCYWCKKPMQLSYPYRAPRRKDGPKRQARLYATFEHTFRVSSGNPNKKESDKLSHYKCNIKMNNLFISLIGGSLFNRYVDVRKRFEKLKNENVR